MLRQRSNVWRLRGSIIATSVCSRATRRGWYEDDQSAKPGIPDRDLDGKDDRAEAAGTGAGVECCSGRHCGRSYRFRTHGNPSVGPIVAAGWLVSTLAGAAAGSAAGGVLGALTQAGVGKDEADIYAESLRRGGAVVSSRVPDADASRLQAVLDNSAVKVADRAALYRKSGWKTFDPTAAPYTAEQAKKERSLYM